jgi:formylglycine-generating enzyme
MVHPSTEVTNGNLAPDSPTGPTARPGRVRIDGATFVMRSNHHYPEEAPAHKVRVSGFWMDRHTVTNAAFERFVDATGYITTAERPAKPEDYPGALPDMPGK